MFLDKLVLSGFRSFDKGVVYFQEHLTILAGENNSGKSNVIDAIRLITSPVNDRRDRYAEPQDIHRKGDLSEFKIEAWYQGLSPVQKGLMITAVPDPSKNSALWGMCYKKPESVARYAKPVFYAGREGGNPEPEARELIRHIYLPALRDAQRTLASNRGFEIAHLLRQIATDKEQVTSFEQKAVEAHKMLEAEKLIVNTNEKITEGLSAITDGVRPQIARLGFASADLDSLARDLRFKLSDRGIEPVDLAESGMGYANLLYIACVLIELQAAREAELTLFLVEEPEAHLHPALQNVLLELLLEKAREANTQPIETGQPAGHIQVIVTTHSPVLTASIKPENLVILKSEKQDGACCRSCSIPISKLGIAARKLRKVERYLDITRSTMLFSPSVILVEGISELLLLRSLAGKKRKTGDWTKEQYSRFSGAALISIEGVDFSPYVGLLLMPTGDGSRIADRVVVITDTDPKVPGNRIRTLTEHGKRLKASERLHIFHSSDTLETDLFISGNEQLLKGLFSEKHPVIAQEWPRESDGNIAERAGAFRTIFERSRERKGDFAQRLSEAIDNDKDIRIPVYIENALAKIVE